MMQKRTVLITGGGGNLGKATISHFLNRGWRVIATVSPGNSLSGFIHKDLHSYAIDLTDEHAVSDWLQAVLSEFSPINAALLLAGGYQGGTLADATQEQFRRMFMLNVETAMNVMRVIFYHMKSHQSGRIIFIGAKPALEATAAGHAVAYALSKAQLVKLTEFVNAFGKEHGVTGYCLVPEIIDTPENLAAMPKADYNKWIKPDKMAEVMLRLCDEQIIVTESIIRLY